VFTITLNNITKAPEVAPTRGLDQLPPELLQQLQQQGLEIQPDDVAEEPQPELETPAAEAPAAETVSPAESF
jgi:hypothetical protein